MYSLNTVIKTFKEIIKLYKPDSIEYRYYKIIVEYLILENKFSQIVLESNKPIYYYFRYNLPICSKDYFEYLYNQYNPVRFAVETFDSIEEIRVELLKT